MQDTQNELQVLQHGVGSRYLPNFSWAVLLQQQTLHCEAGIRLSKSLLLNCIHGEPEETELVPFRLLDLCCLGMLA